MKIYSKNGLWWYYNEQDRECNVHPDRVIHRQYKGQLSNGVHAWTGIIDMDRSVAQTHLSKS